MMFGMLLGTVCLFLFLAMMLRPHRHFAHAHAGGCGRSHGPPWRHRHGGFGRSEESGSGDADDDAPRGRRGRSRRDRAAWLRREAARRLNLDEHQQDVVEVAVRQADKAMKTLIEIVDESRDELADAVKGDQIDQARLDAVFEKWDESLLEARKDVVDALRRGHAALDPDQRRRLSEWIALAGWSR